MAAHVRRGVSPNVGIVIPAAFASAIGPVPAAAFSAGETSGPTHWSRKMSHGVVMNTAGVADGDGVVVEARNWYRESGTVVAEAMGVDPQVGLPSDAARERLASGGPNRLDEVAGRSALATFLDQFRNRLILILVGAGVIAFLVSGEPKDPIIIGIVVLFNAVLGFVQERRAEASLAALKEMLVTTARVRRDGEVHEIAADGLVPGDVDTRVQTAITMGQVAEPTWCWWMRVIASRPTAAGS